MSWIVLRSLFARYGRWVLLIVGTFALVWLVQSVGIERVGAVIVSAGRLLPVIFLLEAGWALCEGIGFLVLLGPALGRLPLRAWFQGTLAHYVTMTILPVGRAGAEVLRAAIFAPFVGRPEAASSGALLQSGALMGNAMVSLVCSWFAAQCSAPLLTGLLVGNGAVTFTLSIMIYLGLARARQLTQFRWLRRFASFGEDVLEGFQRSRPRHALALVFVTLGRLVQTIQYGVIIVAVSGSFSLEKMFLAEGIHLIGAGLGDMVPNQVGVQEGAYRAFAPALGFAEAPERAVAVALLGRLAVLSVAATSALLLQLFRGSRMKAGAPSLSESR
jgi:hypothetical protein